MKTAIVWWFGGVGRGFGGDLKISGGLLWVFCFNMLMTAVNANTDLPLLGIFDLPPIGFCNEFL